MKKLGIILLEILFCTMSFAGVLPTEKPSMAVKVEAGDYTVLGKKVKVASTVELPVAPPAMIRVQDERHVIGDEKAEAYRLGFGMNKTFGPVDTFTRLPKAIAPETVKVHSEAGGGTAYLEDKDYFLDHEWGGVRLVENSGVGGVKLTV
jgi:hypothetical protein